MGGDGEVDVKFFSCEHFMQVSPALKQLWGFNNCGKNKTT